MATFSLQPLTQLMIMKGTIKRKGAVFKWTNQIQWVEKSYMSNCAVKIMNYVATAAKKVILNCCCQVKILWLRSVLWAVEIRQQLILRLRRRNACQSLNMVLLNWGDLSLNHWWKSPVYYLVSDFTVLEPTGYKPGMIECANTCTGKFATFTRRKLQETGISITQTRLQV